MTAPPAIWMPGARELDGSAMRDFLDVVRARTGLSLPDYAALHSWSVENLEEFWAVLAEEAGLTADGDPSPALIADDVEHAQWFPGLRVNYAEALLRNGDDANVAIVGVSERERRDITWGELRSDVARLAGLLRDWGVVEGDRVVGYLPNTPLAVIALLAAASVGAVWSVCSPEVAGQGAAARFATLEPTVLIAVDSYVWSGAEVDRRDDLETLVAALPTVRHVVLDSPRGALAGVDTVAWEDVPVRSAPPEYTPVAFEAPLWVLFSSGTTGAPKGIVHSHGGILLEHYKVLRLHNDLGPDDRYLLLASTNWMVWNLLVSGLLVGAAIVLLDGNPLLSGPDRVFRVAEETGTTSVGVGAGLVHALAKTDIQLADLGLTGLRACSVTGSPLSPEGFRWLADQFDGRLWVSTASGGTDICSAFVGPNPIVPSLEGRFQSTFLGVALEAWDDSGKPLVGEQGELVITRPMPSMPLYFWGDDGSRLHDSYFSTYPGIWRHGDFITVYPDGSSIIHGRSDATLNRHGVRLGSAEVCAAAETVPEVLESMVIGVEDGFDYYMPMFVVARSGHGDDALADRILAVIRDTLSRRHLPDEIIFVPKIPHTATGKKLEIPVKRLYQGVATERVIDLGAIDDPAAFRHFAGLASAWRATRS